MLLLVDLLLLCEGVVKALLLVAVSKTRRVTKDTDWKIILK